MTRPETRLVDVKKPMGQSGVLEKESATKHGRMERTTIELVEEPTDVGEVVGAAVAEMVVGVVVGAGKKVVE